MLLEKKQIQSIADKLIDARLIGLPIPALSNQFVFSMDDAYAIQKILTENKTKNGDRIVGWKLGYTSLAMRKQMNISEPNYGPLLKSMVLPSGSYLTNNLIQPKVEPEIALMFSQPLKGSVTRDEVYNAVDSAHGCLEVVDSIFEDYKFNIEDNTADGSSAAQFVLGPEIIKNTLDKTEVKFYKNASSNPVVNQVTTGTSKNVSTELKLSIYHFSSIPSKKMDSASQKLTFTQKVS